MSPPYDPQKLTPKLREVLTPYAPYTTTARVRELVERDASPAAEDLVCLAWCEWSDAEATDFDEDVVQFGDTALAALGRALAVLPNHAGAQRLQKTITRRMKAAKRAIAKVLKLAEVDEDKLSLEDAEELAFTILDNSGSSPALLRKAYRLSVRLARELPDVVMVTEERGRVRESYGHTYYHSGHAADALWRAGDREAARPLLWALIEWPVARDVALYDFNVEDSLEHLMGEALERNDASELSRLLLTLKRHWSAIKKQRQHRHFSHDLCDRMLAFGASQCDKESLAFLVELYELRPASSLKKDVAANLARLRERLAA